MGPTRMYWCKCLCMCVSYVLMISVVYRVMYKRMRTMNTGVRCFRRAMLYELHSNTIDERTFITRSWRPKSPSTADLYYEC